MGRRRRSHNQSRYERKINHRQWFTNCGFEEQTINLKQGPDTENVVKFHVSGFKGDDQTILRTRGLVSVSWSTLGSDVLAVLGGIVLPNKTANNASAMELPNPLLDSDTTDWFVWHPFVIPSSVEDTGDASAADVVFSEPNNIPVDSKAKRKMEASESVAWIFGFDAAAAVNAKGFRIGYNLRTLVGY